MKKGRKSGSIILLPSPPSGVWKINRLREENSKFNRKGRRKKERKDEKERKKKRRKKGKGEKEVKN